MDETEVHDEYDFEQEDGDNQEHWNKRALYGFISVVVLAVVFTLFQRGWFSSPQKDEVHPAEQRDASDDTTQEQRALAAEERREQALEQQAAQARGEAIALRRALLESGDEQKTRIAKLDEQLRELLTNDDGKRIAAFTPAVRDFVELDRKKRRTADDVDAILMHVSPESLFEPDDQPLYTPPKEKVDEITDLQGHLDKLASDIRRDQKELHRILVINQSPVLAPFDLQTAINKLEGKDSAEKQFAAEEAIGVMLDENAVWKGTIHYLADNTNQNRMWVVTVRQGDNVTFASAAKNTTLHGVLNGTRLELIESNDEGQRIASYNLRLERRNLFGQWEPFDRNLRGGSISLNYFAAEPTQSTTTSPPTQPQTTPASEPPHPFQPGTSWAARLDVEGQEQPLTTILTINTAATNTFGATDTNGVAYRGTVYAQTNKIGLHSQIGNYSNTFAAAFTDTEATGTARLTGEHISGVANAVFSMKLDAGHESPSQEETPTPISPPAPTKNLDPFQVGTSWKLTSRKRTGDTLDPAVQVKQLYRVTQRNAGFFTLVGGSSNTTYKATIDGHTVTLTSGTMTTPSGRFTTTYSGALDGTTLRGEWTVKRPASMGDVTGTFVFELTDNAASSSQRTTRDPFDEKTRWTITMQTRQGDDAGEAKRYKYPLVVVRREGNKLHARIGSPMYNAPPSSLEGDFIGELGGNNVTLNKTKPTSGGLFAERIFKGTFDNSTVRGEWTLWLRDKNDTVRKGRFGGEFVFELQALP